MHSFEALATLGVHVAQLPSFRFPTVPPATHVTPSAAAPQSRSGSVDLHRGLAIYAVVWFHCAAPYAWAGYTGLHALTALSVYFAARTSTRRNAWPAIVRGRFDRLIVPWLFWSALYAALLIARHSRFAPWMALAGPSIHLWFLPYIFVIGTAVTLAARAGWLALSPAGAIGLAACAAALAAANAVLVPRLGGLPPITQWVDVAPAVMIGLAAAAVAADRRSVMRLAVVAALAFAAATAVVFACGLPMANPRWAIGIALFVSAFLAPMPGTATTAFIGRTSYGVYLSHELVKQVVLRVGAPSHSAMTATLVILLALALTATMERTWLRRFVG